MCAEQNNEKYQIALNRSGYVMWCKTEIKCKPHIPYPGSEGLPLDMIFNLGHMEHCHQFKKPFGGNFHKHQASLMGCQLGQPGEDPWELGARHRPPNCPGLSFLHKGKG